MTDLPTRLGRTRGLLTLLAVLVLGSAVGAAAYAARQREPQAARPSAAAGRTSPTVAASVPPSATPGLAASTAGQSPPSLGTKAPKQTTRPPDSAVEPAVADPAAGLTPEPQRTWDTPPTCGQWRNLLSGQQRTSYAATQLRTAWKNDGSAEVPPASTIRGYRAAITAACAGKARADGNVSDVARAVYAADPGSWGP